MKNKIIYITLLGVCTLISKSQNLELEKHDCNSFKTTHYFEKSERRFQNNKNDFLKELPSELTLNFEKIYEDGTIIFTDKNNLSLDKIKCFLNQPDDVTFVKDRESVSRINQERIFTHYQQYYKNVLIENGGFSIVSEIESGKILEFSPSIITLNEVDTKKILSEDSIISWYNNKNQQLTVKDLRFIDLGNKYNLVWLCYLYSNMKEPKKLLINAFDGKILLETTAFQSLLANTPTYGNVNLNNRILNGLNSLQWPINQNGQTLGIYEFDSFILGMGTNLFTEDKIPTTTNSNWNNDAHYVSRQAFHTANAVLPAFINMGVTFGDVHIATRRNTPVANAWAFDFSTLADAYIGMGTSGTNGSGPTMATFDFVAHELGHVYLFQFLNTTNDQQNNALHEGISDIIGCFIENTILPNGTDWVMGGDDPALKTAINRDLKIRVCLNNETDKYRRGLAIGHWFYAITTGIPSENIPAIGIQNAMDILVDALSGLNNKNANFQDLRERTITVALENYGQCSVQYKAIANAWERVCVNGTILSCPCDNYIAPTLSENNITNNCGQNEINLNLLHTGQAPANTALIWSTDSSPSDGISPILSGFVTQTGVYYAYYFNNSFNCFSAGTSVQVVTECGTAESLTVYNNLVVSENGSYCSITIKPGVTLTINNAVIQMADNIVVEDGGKIVMNGGLLTNCPNISSWQGIQAWGNPFFGQSHAVELKNGAIIENAEIGINTSNIVPGGIFGPYFNLSGAKVTVENSTIRNCGIGVNFGPYGYSGQLFSWSDQSNFTNTTFNNCGTGVILQSNLGVEFSVCSFTGNLNTIGIEIINSQVDVTGCEFEGGQGMFFSATWPSLVGSNITDNSFFGDEGIYMDAQGNASPHLISENFFGGNIGIYSTGQSFYYIQSNDFTGSTTGLYSGYTGDEDFNKVSDNGFLGFENGTEIDGVNNIEYNSNCFSYSSNADILMNPGASIFTSQGEEDFEAGNCFSLLGVPQILTLGSVPFDYFLKKGTINQSCKQPGSGNFSKEDAIQEISLNCGSGIWSNLPPNYRNCLLPLDLGGKKMMQAALISEIKRIKNDPNIPPKLKKWLIARYERCLKRLKDEIGLQIIREEQNGKEKGIEYFSAQPLFSHKIMAYALMVESGEYARANAYLLGLVPENGAQADFVTANNLYLLYLTNQAEFILSNQTKESLKEIAVKPNELSGYARSIYYALTGERLRMIVNKGNEVRPRSNYTETEDSISSFPNPVLNNEHIVIISSNLNNRRYVIKVVDVTGKMVNSISARVGENKLDLSNIQNGIYIIEVFSEGVRLFTTKIVKL